MSELPQVSGPDVVRALQQLGFTVRRQHGGHIIMRRDAPLAQTVVPNHRQIDRGTLRAICHDATRAALLDRIAVHCASLPVLDRRSDEDVLGYDDRGLPR